jgi:hypothetical protein
LSAELITKHYTASVGYWIGDASAPAGERVLVSWYMPDLMTAAENADWPELALSAWVRHAA